MKWLREFCLRLAGFLGWGPNDRDLDRELEFHLEMEAEECRGRGLSSADALRVARIHLGGVEKVKQEYRDQRGLPFIEERIQDLKFAWRSLRRVPAFTLTVILVGALGIGANTAIFSILNQTLLESLPYPDSQRLAVIGWDYTDGSLFGHNWAMYDYLKENFQGGEIAAFSRVPSGSNLTVGKEAWHIRHLPVSADYFEVLGIPPRLGRPFDRNEDREGGPEAIVLSDGLWQDLFQGRPDVLGSEVRLGSEAYTVVGIMPSGFESSPRVDAWTPLRADSNPQGAGYNYLLLTRLRTNWPAAREQMKVLSAGELAQRMSENNAFVRFRLEPYQTRLTAGIRPALLLVSGAVALVLLLAIANISCLLLARAQTRRAEIAVRVALGGGRGRISRQILTECVLLAMLAGGAGLALSQLLIRVLPGLTPMIQDPGHELALSWPVLLFAFLVSTLAGLLFGLVPAWQASGEDASSALQRVGSRGSTGSGARFRRILVIAEVSICVVLLVLAGLLLRTFVNLRSVDPGFDPRNVLTARMSLQGSHLQSAESVNDFYRTALERIRAQPGVVSAAVANNLPIEGGLNLPLVINTPKGRVTQALDWRYVSPEYFQLLGIPLLEGRYLEESDIRSSQPVMVVNEAFRRDYFEGREVLRQSVGIYPFTNEIAEPDRSVVGVVGNVKDHGLDTPATPTVYVPVDQVTWGLLSVVHSYFEMQWLIKVSEETPLDAASLRAAVRTVDPLQPFSGFQYMKDVMESSIAPRRSQLFVLGAFALLALVMAMAGVYGLTAFQVAQQSRELGIRIAVGATPRNLLTSQLAGGLRLAALGLVFGFGFSLLASRLVESFLFGVAAIDPWTFLWVGLLVLLVSALATFVPALRTTHLDPVRALAV